MAVLGQLRYYITIKTFTQSKNVLGSAQREIDETLNYFAAVNEVSVSEQLKNGIAEGKNRIDVEIIRTDKTIKAGDEIIYKDIIYRIDSIKEDRFKNRTYISGKATDRG